MYLSMKLPNLKKNEVEFIELFQKHPNSQTFCRSYEI